MHDEEITSYDFYRSYYITYQYFVNLALIIHVYVLRKQFFSFSVLIYIISILSTYSTTGYVILAIVLTFLPKERRQAYKKYFIAEKPETC